MTLTSEVEEHGYFWRQEDDSKIFGVILVSRKNFKE